MSSGDVVGGGLVKVCGEDMRKQQHPALDGMDGGIRRHSRIWHV